jgi:hypothetical protein
MIAMIYVISSIGQSWICDNHLETESNSQIWIMRSLLADTEAVLPSNTILSPRLLPDLSRSMSTIMGARVAPFSPVGCKKKLPKPVFHSIR